MTLSISFTPPPAVLLARLPEPSRAILQSLRDRYDEANTLNGALHDKFTDAWNAKGKAAQAYAKLTDAHQSMAYRSAPALRPDDPAAEEAKAVLDAAQAEFERVETIRGARAHTSGQLRALLDRIDAYLATIRDGAPPLEPYAGDTKPGKKAGEEIVQAVDRVRKEIAGIQAELAAVKAAPHPAADVKRRVREEIDQLVQRGRPSVYEALEYGEPVKFAECMQTFPLEGAAQGPTPARIHGLAGGMLPDALALVAWLHRDTLLAALEREIDEVADDKAALSDSDRTTKLAALRKTLLQLERSDCALIKLSHGALAYRVDSDPRAVLELADSAPQPAEKV